MSATGLPMTVRTVYIINPEKVLKLALTYPASTGRNFDEVGNYSVMSDCEFFFFTVTKHRDPFRGALAPLEPKDPSPYSF